MMLFVASLLVVFMIASPKTNVVHPGATAMVTGESIEGLECRPANDTRSVLDQPAPTRAKHFSALGNYECIRPVFNSEERDVFVERLIQSESLKAKRVAPEINAALSAQGARRARQEQVGKTSKQSQVSKKPSAGEGPLPLRLRVEGSEVPEIARLIESIYRSELIKVLPPGSLSRLPVRNSPTDAPIAATTDAPGPILAIEVRRVDSPDLMTNVRLLGVEGETKWRDL